MLLLSSVADLVCNAARLSYNFVVQTFLNDLNREWTKKGGQQLSEKMKIKKKCINESE